MAFSKQQFEVALTCEFAFLQSCVDIEPLHDALVQLDAVQAVLHNYASAWKLQNVFLGSMGLRLEHSLATELVSIRLKLNQLGFPQNINTEISNLVLPKLKMVINNTKLLHHTKHNFIISTSASVVCGLLVLALVCSLTLKCYRKLLKPICCLRKETDNLKPTCSRKHSDDADCDSENRHECLDPIDARNK